MFDYTSLHISAYAGPTECEKCAHGCTVESGKVVCQCPEGETLASDGVTCVGKSVS